MSVDLSTTYLGFRLKNPLVISACPLTAQIDQLRRLEEAGAAAAVLPSLFEEQIEHDAEEMIKVYEFGTDSFAEALTYFPEQQDYTTGPEEYLETIARAKKAVDIPVIASLNGTSKGGWIRYAKMMQDAGADALELNIYFVAADAESDGPRRGIALSRPRGRREAVDLDSLGGQGAARTSARWPTWACAWRKAAPTAWCCSTASSSPTSIWTRWRRIRNFT